MQRNQQAFTLVELLVVVAIIALLISILLPSLQGARESAWTVKCGSNLRQVGVGNEMYANKWDGYYVPMKLESSASLDLRYWPDNPGLREALDIGKADPHFDEWPDGLRCPKVPDDRRRAGVKYSYGINTTNVETQPSGAGWGGFVGVHGPSVQRNAETAQYADATDWHAASRWNANHEQRWDIYGEAHGASGADPGVAYRHEEGTNLLFFDGHTERLDKSDAFPDDWEDRTTLWNVYKN